MVALLATQPVPAGPRVGVVTNAGGPGILLADACEAHGLKLPELTEDDGGAAALLPARAGRRAQPGRHDRLGHAGRLRARHRGRRQRSQHRLGGRRLRAAAGHAPPRTWPPPSRAARATVPAHKPVLTVFLSSQGRARRARPGAARPAAVLQLPRERGPRAGRRGALRTLAGAAPRPRWPASTPKRATRCAAVVERALDGADGAGLARAGRHGRGAGCGRHRPGPRNRRAGPRKRPARPSAWGTRWWPRRSSPGLLHKSDVGGVVLGLESAAEVRRPWPPCASG